MAGVSAKEQSVYKCPDCGVTLTYAMPDDLKYVIELGLTSEDARKNLTYHGVPLQWSFIKNRYTNLEDGLADTLITLKKEHAGRIESLELEYANELAALIIKKQNDGGLESEMSVDEQQKVWEEINKEPLVQAKQVIDAATAEHNAAAEKELNKWLENYHAEVEKFNSKQAALDDEKKSLEQNLQQLGFFKLKEKKAIKERLAQIEIDKDSVIQTLSIKKIFTDEELAEEISKKKEQSQVKLTKKANSIKTSFNISKSPKELYAARKEWNDAKAEYYKQGKESGTAAGLNSYLAYKVMVLFDVSCEITGSKPTDFELTDSQIALLFKQCFNLEYSTLRISTLMMMLAARGIVRRELSDQKKSYPAT